METISKNINDLQPSQLYLSAKKIKEVKKYFDSVNLEEIEPLPIKKIGYNVFLTDGHTRAYLLKKNGIENIKVYYDQDDLDWLKYMVCVNWAKKAGINKISDLEDKIIDHSSYKKRWIAKCEKMHQNIENDIFNFVEIEKINDPDKKNEICYKTIDNLDNWFGKEDTNQKYSRGVRKDFFLSAQIGNIPIGFISVKDHNQFTSEVYVVGILKEFHKKGIGERLIKIASNRLSKDNKKFLTVKTLSGSNTDKYYKKTRKFYKSMDFYPLEEMPELWSEEEPCLYMVKILDD